MEANPEASGSPGPGASAAPVSVVERGRPCATAAFARISPITIARPAMSATARRPMMYSLLELPVIHRSFPLSPRVHPRKYERDGGGDHAGADPVLAPEKRGGPTRESGLRFVGLDADDRADLMNEGESTQTVHARLESQRMPSPPVWLFSQRMFDSGSG